MDRRPVLIILAMALAFGISGPGISEAKSKSSKKVKGLKSVLKVLVKFNVTPQVEVIQGEDGEVHVIIHGHNICAAEIPENKLAKLMAHATVEFVEPDVQFHLPGCHHDDPPPTVPPGTLPTGIDRVDAELSSAASGDGQGAVDVDIAVLDTGIDLDHPDLNVVSHVSFVSGVASGNDDHGHGSHVAGTAAAKDDGVGTVGVAPGARLWSVKVADQSGSSYTSVLLLGIDYVTRNASSIDVAVVTLAFAGTASFLDTALAGSTAAGVTYAVAAGNGGGDAANYTPASNPHVLAVSAIVDTDGRPGGLGAATEDGADDTLASFSNRGPAVDIAAPGSGIVSTWKDGLYQTVSGTSASAPFVGGAAALYRAAHPGASPAEVRQALIDHAFPQAGPSGFSGDTDGSAEPLLNAGAF